MGYSNRYPGWMMKVREGDSSWGTVIATVEGGRMSAAAAACYLLLM